MYKEVFALRIKAKRKELGYSQITVSNETGINQSQISKFESESLEPNLETLGILANYYQVSIDWLLGNTHNGKDGNILKAALNDYLERIIKIINSAAYQNRSKEETIDWIIEDITEEKDIILKEYIKKQGEE